MIAIVEKEMRAAISDLELDLSGITVLTEAASGVFAYTPLMAILAGAKVYAVGKDSKYGSLIENERNIRSLAEQLSLPAELLTIYRRDDIAPYLDKVDIVANLGFVRPIDEMFVSALRPGTVISYMCEAWEHRKDDLDLAICSKYNIPVLGINEEHPLVNCFRETGLIALQMMFESKISVYDSNILILSRDKFGVEIQKTMELYTNRVRIMSDFSDPRMVEYCNGVDVIIVADYLYDGVIIGRQGILDPQTLKLLSPSVQIIQYCGANAFNEIREANIAVYPQVQLPVVRMARTLADISYKSMIRLHAGGLKVGELAYRNIAMATKFEELAQPMGVTES